MESGVDFNLATMVSVRISIHMNEVRYLATGTLFLSDEGPMLETLDHTIRIGNAPTFLYFDLYLYSAYAAHYVYLATVVAIDHSIYESTKFITFILPSKST